MIGTVEQKFRTASNGTEFTNNQPLLMDGVMIQHIVFLEQQRVSYKIIINSIVTNLYSRILYNSITLGGESMKTKSAVSEEDALKALGGDSSVAPDDMFPTITEADLKDVKVEKKDGKKTITTALSESAIKKITDSMADGSGDETTAAGSVSVKDVAMTVSFDKKDQVTDLRLTFKMSLSVMGQKVDAEMDILMEVNSINKTEEIKAPADADQYKEDQDLFD